MKIQHKLFLAFLFGSLVLVATMYGLMQWSFDKGMIDYVNERELNSQAALAPLLAGKYRDYGSWDFIKGNHTLWRNLIRRSDSSLPYGETTERPQERQRRRPPPNGPNFAGPGVNHPPPPRKPLRIVLLDDNKQSLFGPYDPNQKTPLLPIEVNGKTVGWLTLASRKNMPEAYDIAFVSEQKTTYLVISGIMLLLSACFAYPLASWLTQPIKKLAAATHALASGNYDLQIKHNSKDELGQLTRDFNHLAQTLAANESARKRWIADISHELRTPLGITRGELEAMMDGIRPINKENIHSTHQEILRLQRIVDDLHELAKADIGALSYQMEPLDLNDLLQSQVAKFTPQAESLQLSLKSDLPTAAVKVWADKTRITQLMTNLLTNSMKYTDPNGTVSLRLTSTDNRARLIIEDSSPGVPLNTMEKLFDPLYRFESSRNRKTGGSGLGLAICKKIVEGHNGTIKAEASYLGGLKITVTLPIGHSS